MNEILLLDHRKIYYFQLVLLHKILYFAHFYNGDNAGKKTEFITLNKNRLYF